MFLHDLFKKRPAKYQWIFVAIALFSFFWFMWGARQGFGIIFIVSGFLCLIQLFYPTVFIWGTYYYLFRGGILLYGFWFVQDIYRMLTGSRPVVLTSISDTINFFVLWGIMMGAGKVLSLGRPYALKGQAMIDFLQSIRAPVTSEDGSQKNPDGIAKTFYEGTQIPAEEFKDSTAILYRRTGEVMEFFQVLRCMGIYMVREGRVGEHRDCKFLKDDLQQSAVQQAKSLIQQKKDEGYQKINKDMCDFLVIEFPMSVENPQVDLEIRLDFEERMGKLLEETGLGYCDGGSVGNGTMEVFCFVVDYAQAERVTIEDMRNTEFSCYSRIYRADREYAGRRKGYCMDREVFWGLIEKSRRNTGAGSDECLPRLKDALGNLGLGHIIGFQNALNERVAELDRFDLLAANFMINGYVSDDAFESFRIWLVFQGREHYEKALIDVESIAGWLGREDIDAINGDEWTEVVLDAYIEAGGNIDGFYDNVFHPEENILEQVWPEDKAGFEERWPLLYRKFWNEDRIRELHPDRVEMKKKTGQSPIPG